MVCTDSTPAVDSPITRMEDIRVTKIVADGQFILGLQSLQPGYRGSVVLRQLLGQSSSAGIARHD